MEKWEGQNHTRRRSRACHAIPPAVAKSMQEIPRAPKDSNFPCPEQRKGK